MAEDLARRSGLTLNEWLARLMADEGPEDAASQGYFSQGSPNYVPVPRSAPAPRYEAAGHPPDEVGRVAQALERLSDRIEAAESRQALAIAGVERSVREVIARIDAAEREQMQVAARFEGVAQNVQVEQDRLAERVRRVEMEAQGPRSTEALRALEGAIGKVAGHLYETERRSREAITEIGAQVERLGGGEQLTASAIRELRSTCGALDGRLGVVEHGAADGIEQVAANLSARVEAVREELADRLAATADSRFDRVEQALAQMSEHVKAAEQRGASALERMGREVLEVAQTLSRRVQGVEHRSAEAADRMGAEVSRIANAVEGRLAHADSIQAQALEKLGGEIARITERLADRIASAERRSAQAIDDVGEQVSRVTERIGQRHERVAGELAERIRQSEERTARLLEEARQKIDARLAETQGRLTEIQARPAAPTRYEEPDDSLFGGAPFPAYEAPPPAERPFARPAPAAVYSPTLREARPEPPAFEEEDFDAAAELSEPSADAPFVAEAPAARPSTLGAFPEVEIGPVELEPNVGFDMDDEPAPLIAADAASPIEAPPHAEAIIAASGAPAEPAEAREPRSEPDRAPEAVEAVAADEGPFDAPLTTREVIERARAAARAASERERPSKSPRAPLRPVDDGVLQGLAFGRSRKRPPNLTGALMVASLLAAVSLSAGGFVVLEGQPGGKLPQRVADALATVHGEKPQADTSAQNQPSIAALALAPKSADAQASVADLTQAYSAAVAEVSAGEAAGLASIRQLADQGYAPAQFYLSMLYEDGRAGLKKDPAQARHWTERAADGGDRAAMHNLALDDFQGVGGRRDPAAAAEWFRRAADLGLVDSQFNLAGLYEHGEGVGQNAAEAYKWYLIAAHAGDAEAHAAALHVRAQLSPEARAVAERAAAAFTPTTPATTLASATSDAGSPDLVTAQRALNQLGYYQGPTDGVSSPALRMAIAAYQRDQALPVTGDADAATLGKLSVYTR